MWAYPCVPFLVHGFRCHYCGLNIQNVGHNTILCMWHEAGMSTHLFGVEYLDSLEVSQRDTS